MMELAEGNICFVGIKCVHNLQGASSKLRSLLGIPRRYLKHSKAIAIDPGFRLHSFCIVYDKYQAYGN